MVEQTKKIGVLGVLYDWSKIATKKINLDFTIITRIYILITRITIAQLVQGTRQSLAWDPPAIEVLSAACLAAVE